MPVAAVSWSRISPTMITSGSARSGAHRDRGREVDLDGPDLAQPGCGFRPSSAVQIFKSMVLMQPSPECRVGLAQPVGADDEGDAIGPGISGIREVGGPRSPSSRGAAASRRPGCASRCLRKRPRSGSWRRAARSCPSVSADLAGKPRLAPERFEFDMILKRCTIAFRCAGGSRCTSGSRRRRAAAPWWGLLAVRLDVDVEAPLRQASMMIWFAS
jgi:hypothetical protein